jgi:hypothetical protein
MAAKCAAGRSVKAEVDVEVEVEGSSASSSASPVTLMQCTRCTSYLRIQGKRETREGTGISTDDLFQAMGKHCTQEAEKPLIDQ